MPTHHAFGDDQIRVFNDFGRNNEVVVGEGSFIQLLRIRAHRVKVHIGDNCRLLGRIIINANGAELHIGSGTTFNQVQLSMSERSVLRIGTDCMFSGDIWLDVSDIHSIVDAATGRRLNPPAPITIGDHVWIGHGVKIVKGATIGSHSIVGIGSVVTGEIPSNSIAAGVPARVVRSGVSWERERLMTDADMDEEINDQRLLRTARPRRQRPAPRPPSPREAPAAPQRLPGWQRILRLFPGGTRA